MEIEELEIEVLGRLYTLENDVLTQLCNYVKVSEAGKTKRQVLKDVRAAIEEISSGE